MISSFPIPHWLDSPSTAKILGEIRPVGADWIGLRIVTEISESVFVRDGNPESEDLAFSSGAMIEVQVAGHFGYFATPDLTIKGLKRAAAEAMGVALSVKNWGIAPSKVSHVRPAVSGRFSSPALEKRGLAEVSREALEALTQLSAALKVSSRIHRTVAGFETKRTEIRTVSSSGADIRQTFIQSTPHLLATARDGDDVQTRTNYGHSAQSKQSGIEMLFNTDLHALAVRTGEEALALLEAPNCPTQETTLLLMPDQMMLQIHESIGHPLELDRILGDERNYAGSSFVKTSDFGTLQYGSSLLNVTFDPTVSGEFASYAFDDCGAPAEKEFLIRNGRLERALGGRDSQARSGLPGTSNMRASSWNRPPIDRMANINLEAGNASLAELISGIEDGVLMASNRSWSIDDYRNKFQFGCEYAREIKEGQLGRVLKNPNYRGVTLPFWKSLIAVGGSETLETYGTPNCGKGEPNQAISVGHRSPACVFEKIAVFGGEN